MTSKIANLDSNAVWRKSSYSNGSGGDCVEVAPGTPGVVPVRDSKQSGNCRSVLVFPADGWGAFVAAVKGGHF